LRLAGLVRLALGEGERTRRYAARIEALEATWDSLRGFLEKPELEDGAEDGDG
jgi:hypothetical protein